MLNDWKTTLTSLFTALAVVLRAFGVDVPPPVLDVAIGIGVLLLGYFAKDK